MYTKKKKPSVANYVVAAIIMVGGIIGFIAFLFTRLSAMGDQPTYLIPGTHTLECSETGMYTIFHEYQSIVDGQYYSSPQGSLGGLRCIITSDKDDTLRVTPVMANSTYSIGSRQGYAISKFKVEVPGSYTFEAILPEGGTEQAVLTISHGFMSEMFTTILGAMGILFGSIVLGVIIIIVTIVKQVAYNKEQKLLQQQGGAF